MERSRQGRAAGAIATILVAMVACAPAPSVPTVAADPLPFEAERERALEAEDLAADAVERDALVALLDDTGFVGATERTGADRPNGVYRVAVRAIGFSAGDGADAYLDWLDGHVHEVIGDAERLPPVAVAAADRSLDVFRHVPGDCCPKETVAYLTAWRDDATVVTVELGGPSVGPDDVAATAAAVHLGSAT